MLNPDRYFSPVPAVRDTARALYSRVAELPLVCPHGHVDPRMLALDAPFPNPAALIVIPDHYLVRMLYSQGVPMESLGHPAARRRRGRNRPAADLAACSPTTSTCSAGTPSGAWLAHEFEGVLRHRRAARRRVGDAHLRPHRRAASRGPSSARERSSTASRSRCSARPTPRPTRSSGIARLRHSGWTRRHPADLPAGPRHQHPAIHRGNAEIDRLRRAHRTTTFATTRTYIRALESRRAFFKSMGATATDHAAETPFTAELSPAEATRCSSARWPDATEADGRARSPDTCSWRWPA